MKVVLFCGRAGMWLADMSMTFPNPMVRDEAHSLVPLEYCAHFGHKDFVLCHGFKGSVIKDYFVHYEAASNDFVWSQGGKQVQFLNRDSDDWTLTFAETGATLRSAGG